MIDNNAIQAGLVSYLKADSALVAFLTQFGAGDEIRESEWQGREFLYPNVRVEIGTQVETGNPPCYSEVPITIYCYSERDSSKEANQLAGLVNAAMIRQKFSGTGFISGLVISDGSIAARRTNERVWQAVNQYRCNIYGGTFS